jgi:hypothetical protein
LAAGKSFKLMDILATVSSGILNIKSTKDMFDSDLEGVDLTTVVFRLEHVGGDVRINSKCIINSVYKIPILILSFSGDRWHTSPSHVSRVRTIG